MKTSARFLMGLLVSAFVLVVVIASPTMAQDKAKAAVPEKGKAVKGQPTIKMLLDNDKYRAFEGIYEPGDENKSVPKEGRVVRAMTSGTLMRIYPDGKTEKIEWKAGEVRFSPPAAGGEQYTTKNVGKSKLVLYVVVAK